MVEFLGSPFLGTPLRYLLVALGIYPILHVSGFLDLSLASVLVIGSYVCLLLSSVAGVPVWMALLGAAASGAIVAALLDAMLYRTMRTRGSPPAILLLTSLGIYAVLVGMLSTIAGPETRALPLPLPWETWRLGRLHFVPIDVLTLLLCVVGTAALVAVRRTSLGVHARAIASDESLAIMVGIPCASTRTLTYAGGGAIVALAGVLLAADADMTPTMGLPHLMVPAVAVVAGKSWGLLGSVALVMTVGLLQQTTAYFVGPQWSDMLSLCILAILLMLTADTWSATSHT